MATGYFHKFNSKKSVAVHCSKDFSQDDCAIYSQVGVEAQCNEHLLSKTKIDCRGLMSLSLKYKVDSRLTAVGSMEVII